MNMTDNWHEFDTREMQNPLAAIKTLIGDSTMKYPVEPGDRRTTERDNMATYVDIAGQSPVDQSEIVWMNITEVTAAVNGEGSTYSEQISADEVAAYNITIYSEPQPQAPMSPFVEDDGMYWECEESK